MTAQTTLFDVPAPAVSPARRGRGRVPAEVDAAPADAAPAGPRPWDPIDEADRQVGWQYRYVTPARAREIAAEIRARSAR